MNLKTVFSSVSSSLGQGREPAEGLLAIKISATEVSAAVWKVEEGKVQLGQVFRCLLAGDTFEDLLKATDEAVSTFPEQAQKVIFGLPFSWVEEEKIVEEKLALLRRLSKELGFTPLGYILLSEAIENYYKEVEGAPLTAILLEIDGDQGLVTMYRAGKNLGAVPIKAGQDIAHELEEALKNFTQAEVLPSRIIIYDGKGELEKMAERITALPWTKNLPFLHFPKVEIFEDHQIVKAIAVAGGRQMGGHFEAEEKAQLEEISAQEAGFVEMEVSGKKKETLSIFAPLFSKLKEFRPPSIPLPTIPKSRAALIAVLVVIVILGLSGLVIYHFPKATVFLKISSPPFAKELAVTVIAQNSPNPATDSAKTITGSLVGISEVGAKKGVASGHKLVGDRARGSVTIYSASNARNFAAGSLLASPNGLKFSLDRDVSVASGDAITRSTVIGSVTANDIGDSYNLASGTKFIIGSFSPSDYAAQADQALSGGSSHQATVVTKEDQNRLSAALSAELSEKARSDLEAKLEPGQKLLPTAISSSVSKKKFSKDVDVEADTVGLELTMDFTGVIFSQSDLVAVFSRNFLSDIPSGFVLSSDQATVEIRDIKTDKTGNAILSVRLTDGLMPKIDSQEIVGRVSGKSLGSVQNSLKKIAGVTNISVEIKPKFFAFLANLALPWKRDNLKIEIVRE